RLAAAYDGSGRVRGAGRLDAVLFERLAIHVQANGRSGGVTTRNEQGSLGQSIGRIEGFAPEATRGEHLGKLLERFAAHGLRAVEGHVPTAQVELGPLLLGNAPHAKVIGEIRPAAGAGPVT